MKRWIWTLCFLPWLCFAAEGDYPLQHITVDTQDTASLQRGAKWFMNYCSGCHSLEQARYKRMAEDLGITTYEGVVDQELLQQNLIFTSAKMGDHIRAAMPASDAKAWFGKAPPDLTLIARVRGQDWLYTYLISFYEDPTKIWGTNNAVFPDVAMPNVLANLQGTQIPVMKKNPDDPSAPMIVDYLQPNEDGTMSELAFEDMVHDLVNFLVYMGEPVRDTRQFLGYFVLAFVGVFTVLAYLLKKEYWKDIKKQ